MKTLKTFQVSIHGLILVEIITLPHESTTEDEAAESVLREIAEFLDVCRERNILQKSQHRLLRQLLEENA